ncbi:molybdate ABC transporter substrate-binding protein [Pseudoteredinibacter isoporae]|uniref:Molybdate transport system substrate-binding protein n=1 Tax=Pseudoteredinibacter isoporae TaxID=570281 RepID=A0A7X0JSN0_9GAMM|nr:molybdate ABC transporter substrate-binding protein [Pseudoteredinibacter isoporae]MBB6521529.1 molybdate transport system substrate-binding protein [Pseudoteredinibacter isoporae]NHO87083.1 molybdate ABC transporter substrate-binding protein [Pseudoteredinibacter isoporae]NIB22830.1 molybdate ABC transporter substrate-binding protein [Pseudoteredinibacter isoporae]
MSLLVLLGFPAFSGPDATIAVASNFAQTARTLGAEFKKKSGYELRFVLGSSGKIAAQIRHGAPFDLFLSADQERPIQLMEEQLAVDNSRFSYAEGALVLWSAKKKYSSIDARFLEQQKKENQHLRLAIANPKLAPYGRAAFAVLGDIHQRQLVQGENIAQAFQFTRIGQVDAGFIAKSQWLQLPEAQRQSAWEIPRHMHPAILQDAVLLNRAKNNDAAKAFWQYLQSPDAHLIIEKDGYLAPTKAISRKES